MLIELLGLYQPDLFAFCFYRDENGTPSLAYAKQMHSCQAHPNCQLSIGFYCHSFVCMGTLTACMSVHHEEGAEGLGSLNWSYRCLQGAMWLLGLKPLSFWKSSQYIQPLSQLSNPSMEYWKYMKGVGEERVDLPLPKPPERYNLI